jgi:hypothetical protein
VEREKGIPKERDEDGRREENGESLFGELASIVTLKTVFAFCNVRMS